MKSDSELGMNATEARVDVLRVLSLFDDDPIAQQIVLGLMEGTRGDELLASSALSAVEYQSKRRKIRRRLEKLEMK